MTRPRKPPALRKGDSLSVVAPASPADATRLERGRQELVRLGFALRSDAIFPKPQEYFAGSTEERQRQFLDGIKREDVRALVCARGGYGSNYLLDGLRDGLDELQRRQPRILMGYSDITSLEIFLWQKLGWVTFYGPMVAAGLDGGADAPGGYDTDSLLRALSETTSGWPLNLQGESLADGEAEGVLLGGCMTLVEATLGTAWELDTDGAILVLEDRAMKPYQVDRVLMHLMEAGKLKKVRGIILGEFPESEPAVAGSPAVADVCRRILGALGIPVIFGSAVGHTRRPMLTLPLGVRARLRSSAQGQLEILEPAVTP